MYSLPSGDQQCNYSSPSLHSWREQSPRWWVCADAGVTLLLQGVNGNKESVLRHPARLDKLYIRRLSLVHRAAVLLPSCQLQHAGESWWFDNNYQPLQQFISRHFISFRSQNVAGCENIDACFRVKAEKLPLVSCWLKLLLCNLEARW